MKLLEKQKKCLQFISPLVPLVIFAIIIVFIPEKAHAEKIYEVLNPAKNTGPSETVRNVWTQIRNIINYLGMAFLIYVAFMNILRIEMNSYAIKKVLPALIMGVILANFSFLICRFFVDLANVGMDLLINSPGGVNAMSSGNNFGIAGAFALKIDHAKFLTDVDKLNYSYIFAALLFCIVEFAGAIIILILSFLFFLRNYMIYFLVALSPLAFMVSGIPMAKSAWNQWWTQFTKWTFMPIVSLFWLWIGSLWLEPFRNLSGSGTGSGWLLAVIFAGVCFYLAITTPFKMGGAIMGQWSKLGKQVWGGTAGKAWNATGGKAINNYRELYGKKLGNWYAAQGQGSRLNPVGYFARRGEFMKQRIGLEDQLAKGRAEDLGGRVLKDSKGLQRLNNRIRPAGGGMEKAQAEVLADYLETDQGKEWARGRAQWLEEKAVADKRASRGFARGSADFAETMAGKELLAEMERVNQDSLRYEDDLKAVQKQTLVDFLRNTGAFNNRDDEKRLNDRILAMTRNLAWDEAVSNSQQKKIDEVLESQNHLQNMRAIIDRIDKGTQNIDGAIADRIRSDIDGIRGKITAGTATTADRLQLTDLQGDLAVVQSGRTNARIDALRPDVALALKTDIAEQAKAYFAAKRPNPGDAPYLDGMVDAGETDPSKVIKGFQGLAGAMGYSGSDAETIGNLLMTRTGKLSSIQIRGDIDKYEGQYTVGEIGDLIRGHAGYSNFVSGQQYKNDPTQNRELEGYSLTLHKIAKTNSANAVKARQEIIDLTPDDGIVRSFDRVNEGRARAGRPPLAATSIGEMRTILTQQNNSTQKESKDTYSALAEEPMSGVTRNPAEFLSSIHDDAFAGRHTTHQSTPAPNDSARFINAVISQARSNPDVSFSKLSKTLGQGLGDIARSTDELKTTLLQSRVQFATTLSKQMGVNLRQELRPAFAKALAELPRNATAEQIAAKVQEVAPGTSPRIDSSQIASILDQAHTYAGTEKAIQLLSQTQNVADHQTYIQHFSNMTPAAAQQQLQILTQARRQVENIDTPTPEMLSAVTSALQKTGFAPQQGELVSGPKAIDSLFMAQQAAEASVGSYDQAGKLDLDKANDTLAERFINPEQAGNATPIAERPGLHQDIVPPAQSQAPSGQTPETGE